MKISSNASLPTTGVDVMLTLLIGGIFVPSDFQWQAFSAVLYVSGDAYDGYGATGFYYGADSDWEAADFMPDNDEADDLVADWVRSSYETAGPWVACLFRIVRDGGELKVHIEFEFKDFDRWREPDDDRDLGDLLRPSETM